MRELIKESIELIKKKALFNQTSNDIPFSSLCEESRMLLTLANEKLNSDDELITEIERVINILCNGQ